MPAYNSEEFIHDAIESILHQTYVNFQLLIVDDCSSDTTPQIITRYAKRFPYLIKALFQKTHIGDTGCANAAFARSSGQFIARMDADDIAHPERIEKQISFLLTHPQVFILGTQGYVIDKKNTIIGEKLFPLSHTAIYSAFSIYNPLLHPSCMFRRDFLPYPDRLYEQKHNIHDDYYTFFSYLRYGIFANLPDKLLYYRIHGKNFSLQHPKKRFTQIQHIRTQAVKRLGYTMPSWAKFHNLLQQIVVGVLPEQAIIPLYMSLRGMYSPWKQLETLPHLLPSVPLAMTQKA